MTRSGSRGLLGVFVLLSLLFAPSESFSPANTAPVDDTAKQPIEGLAEWLGKVGQQPFMEKAEEFCHKLGAAEFKEILDDEELNLKGSFGAEVLGLKGDGLADFVQQKWTDWPTFLDHQFRLQLRHFLARHSLPTASHPSLASTASAAVSSSLAPDGTDVDLFLVLDGPGPVKRWSDHSVMQARVQTVGARVDSRIGSARDRESRESLRPLLKEKGLLVEDDPVIELFGYLKSFKTDMLFRLPRPDSWDKKRGLFVKLYPGSIRRAGVSDAPHGESHGQV